MNNFPKVKVGFDSTHGGTKSKARFVICSDEEGYEASTCQEFVAALSPKGEDIRALEIAVEALETLKVAVNDKQNDPGATAFIERTLTKIREARNGK